MERDLTPEERANIDAAVAWVRRHGGTVEDERTAVTISADVAEVESLDGLPISPELRERIEDWDGVDDGSAMFASVAAGLLRAGLTDDVVLGVLLSPEWGPGEWVHDRKGAGAEAWARADLARLKAKVTVDEPTPDYPELEEDAVTTKTTAKSPELSYGKPMRSAELYHATRPHLRNYRDEWMEYSSGAYVSVEPAALWRDVARWLQSARVRVEDKTAKGAKKKYTLAAYDVTPKRVSDVLRCLQAVSLIPDPQRVDGTKREPPFWLDREGDDPADLIVCANGLVNTRTRDLIPHTPNYFSRTLLPYAYDPSATAPEWERFVGRLFPDDTESAALLQEMCGYLISHDTSMQCIFALIGVPASGKGTTARVVRGLVGEANTASPTIRSLAGDFGLQPLLYRSLAIIGDARVGPRTDTASLLETLLSISGEDSRSVNRKNSSFWEGRLGVRIMLIANRFPQLGDHTGALARRIVPLRFAESFEGREDRGLTDRLLAELPGILTWALHGLARLRATGRFTETTAGRTTLSELRRIGSPIGRYAEERLLKREGAQVLKSEVYQDFQGWCEENGERAVPSAKLGEELRELLSVGEARPRLTGTRRRPEVYTGVELAEPRFVEVPGAVEQYAHLFPEDTDEVVSAIERLIAARVAC